MTAKKALITGILGQDGAYLAKLLLDKGYEVYGGIRRSSSGNTWRLHEFGIADAIQSVAIDLHEFTNIFRLIDTVRPDELYNLGAQSFVALSFEQPLLTADADGMGVLRILESLRALHPECRFYQASTSEMFGKVREPLQSESTPFHPRSPYGAAKLFGHSITVNYREAYGIHASSGILFNHESPLRGLEFVTRKITHSLALIKYGKLDVLELGNLDALRDWGFAGDFVRGMWMMVQQPKGGDYVLATGENHSVREFVERAARIAGFQLEWEGEGENTLGKDRKSGKTIVRVNPKFYRPAEVEVLLGNAEKAHSELGWRPEKSFDQLVEDMAEADLKRVSTGSYIHH